MKRNWEYKKLGDVCDVIMGQSPASDTYNESEGLPFFQGNADFGKEHPEVRVYCNSPIKIALPNDILISVRAPIGAINIADCKCCIGRGLAAIRTGSGVSNRFIYRLLIASRDKLIAQGTGSTFKSIGRSVLAGLSFPVPPLEEQSRIVAELDLLTGIIDKQNAQLKELDNLAQAIFYDMFGDPIENPKGWDVKKLGAVAQDIFAGGDKPEDCADQPSEEYCYPVIANGVGDRGVLGYSKEYRVGVDAVTVGARGASIGNCRICKAFFTPVVRLITIIPGVNFDIVYLFYAVQLLNFNINGAGQAQLTVPNVKSQNVVVPPLALQQSFAEKIQSIEKQKDAIRASIADTQKLLDYTMDKYFG